MINEAQSRDPQKSAARNAVETYYKVDIVVIGAGQAGLSAAYYLKKQGLASGTGFIVLDDERGPGGAWQHRWDSLTLLTVNGISDLPGMTVKDAQEMENPSLRANVAVPEFYAHYEQRYDLPILRPVKVMEVREKNGRFNIKTNGIHYSARGIINATGTWKTPQCPRYAGWEKFKGIQLHTAQYRQASDFRGQHVIVVGAGISAVQLLGEIAQVTQTSWVTRRPPVFREEPFTEEQGRAAVAQVEARVRQGLAPNSVVSVTGIPVTASIRTMMDQGVLTRMDMFDEITENGVRWKDGRTLQADVIFWNTGFKHSLEHLAPLELKNQEGGITMTGLRATQVAADPRIHLVGYGPSSSTIGANRAGRAAAQELIKTLNL